MENRRYCLAPKTPLFWIAQNRGRGEGKAKILQYWPLSPLKISTLYDGYKLKKKVAIF